jgi:hypothetical protein
VAPNTHNNKLAIYHYCLQSLLVMSKCRHLDLSKHVMHNVSRLRLRAHTLKVTAAVWLENGSTELACVTSGDEHVQNEVRALLFCKTIGVVS